jgi:hypothetical protein
MKEMRANYETCLCFEATCHRRKERYDDSDRRHGFNIDCDEPSKNTENSYNANDGAMRSIWLVPYRRVHVYNYHFWMQDPLLLQATASDQLSIEEEYEMQRSWRDDPNKCTFIILSITCSDNEIHFNTETTGKLNPLPSSFIQRSVSAMIGDVNLFFSSYQIDTMDSGDLHVSIDEPHKLPGPPTTTFHQAEIDIMIARKSYRGKSCGLEAALLMMWYGASYARPDSLLRYFCKIHESNVPSINLFRNKLNFTQCAYAACFQEYEYELKFDTPQQLQQHILNLLRLYQESDQSTTAAVEHQQHREVNVLMFHCPIEEGEE